jgi:hypothetical protein
MTFTNDFEKREYLGREALRELKVLYPNLFKYDLHFTTDTYAAYDAFYHIIDSDTHSITKRVLIEIKIRDRHFPEYILETKKLNSLKKIRKDLGFNEDEMSILYINFCPNETIIWNIDKINNDVKTNEYNKATAVSRKDKVSKDVIMLQPTEGKQLDYILDESKILNKTKINNIVDNKVKELKNDLFKTLFG